MDQGAGFIGLGTSFETLLVLLNDLTHLLHENHVSA
jgi:hypothetical protein